ncbi:MAG: radical SAM family heme chaperone HemW [Clostridiales bacterium]|nr:radical SAM family heme chaperone HemW [Clostridiales bacterium]
MAKAGLYIHIPFCKSKCPYCNFYSVKYDESAAREYAAKIILQMQEYRGASFDTVYFGGGTPSIIKPQLIGEILAGARENFEIDRNSEITIECNPTACSEDAFQFYAEYGINRVSIGMQSAVKAERLALGRTAGKAQIKAAVSAARAAGIGNISLDLMLGTPKQTANSLDETLEFIKETAVPHISAYILNIEKNTPFYNMKDKLSLPDDDFVCDLYLKAVSYLEKAGLQQYEISNFARPGFESRHNTKYWRLDEYLGLGASAHSFLGGKRFYYDSSFNKTDDGCGGTREEKIMLGLRLKSGIDKTLVKDCSQYIKGGFMEEKDGKIAFTPKGFLVSNTIIAQLQ